jgi:hypothetical protein
MKLGNLFRSIPSALIAATLATLVLLSLPALAQEHAQEMSPEEAAMMAAYMKAGAPGEAHSHLAERAGTWKVEIKSWMDPKADPTVSTGTTTLEMVLGGRYLKEVFKANMMGMSFEGWGLTGYENVSGEYWGTWVDNMSTGTMVSRGKWDEKEGALVMKAHYLDPVSGEKVKVRLVDRPDGKDRSVVTFYEDRGKGEVRTMEITYTR